MENPKIIINGKEIELKKAKARLWTTIMKFHSERKNIPTVDLMDKYCEIIALAFGVTTDEVLDNLNIEDVGAMYFSVYDAIVAMLTAKLPKKNIPEEVTA